MPFPVQSCLWLISIHAPREGGDQCPDNLLPDGEDFNPRPPRGGRLSRFINQSPFISNFNPRPPRGGRLKRWQPTQVYLSISIHAPREGGDCYLKIPDFFLIISIHAPREGGDQSRKAERQGTLYFNPRPPRGGRLHSVSTMCALSVISIHAPREGGDFTPI